MAYVSLAQDADPSVAGLDNFSSASPTLHKSLAYEQLSGDAIDDASPARDDAHNSKISKFVSSLTGSQRSYDLVEDDDYEDPQMTPMVERKMMPTMAETMAETANEDIPIRTASISRQLPLHNPKPDLQSLQGAYVKNVERLEESAERLSMTSSLDEELQRMKMEQRRIDRSASGSSHAESLRHRMRQFSATSLSNSIVEVNATARSGGYSPSAYITSPVGSIKSGNPIHSSLSERRPSKTSRLGHVLPEPELEGRPLDFGLSPPTSHAVLDPQPPASRSVSNASQADRPGTPASGDTFQQANTLFTDFDGVHYDGDRPGASRQISLNHPPRARDSRAFKEPQPGEQMIYYPAPVPVMLNLPMRLSKSNWSEQEKKRLKTLGGIPDDARKSALWLAGENGASSISRESMAGLPPQLRASAFFDHRAVEHNVQLKDGSAVATLDSILDAAAYAPVSAFVDHPIAGHLGTEVYGTTRVPRKSMQIQPDKKAKRRSSLSNLLKRRSSGNLSTEMTRQSQRFSGDNADVENAQQSGDDLDDEATRSIAPTTDELPLHDRDGDGSENGSDVQGDHLPGFSAAPTTLLAELQMRKAQQKERNRTAANAFPNGMHSTLLELDTVTQLQQRARKQKHIKLAWEDHEAADKQNYDDEDVPLALLFPEKKENQHINLNRPIGLMERREMEENEPLSSRRARLRGEPIVPPPADLQSLADNGQANEAQSAPVLDLPGLVNSGQTDDADESLAQRMRRMKNRRDDAKSGYFASEVDSQLGLRTDDMVKTPNKTPDPEETLGQRRRRLKEEAQMNGSRNVSGESADATAKPALRPSRSMADVLQRNPIGYQHPNESKAALAAMQNHHPLLNRNSSYISNNQAPNMTTAYNAMHSPMTTPMDPSIFGYPTYQYPNPAMSSYMGGPMYNPMTTGYGTQMPMNMNMSMNMGTNPIAYPYGISGYEATAAAIGMGPPLDAKQRANIDRWRQSVA